MQSFDSSSFPMVLRKDPNFRRFDDATSSELAVQI